MLTLALRVVFGCFYLYGASVHVLNMLSQTGFDWPIAPVKWKLLDIVYLILDVGVVYGLLLARAFGTVLLVIAASSQIILYTAFRDWVLDVPDEFMPDDASKAYLNTLVGFHIVTLVVVAIF